VVDLTRYDGTTFALLLRGETADGEEDWIVCSGVARLKGESLFLERSAHEPDVEIRQEWFDRIRPTDDEARGIFQGAEFFLSLTVGNLSGDQAEGMEPFGFQWPSDTGPNSCAQRTTRAPG
jgi:hypothetical protein